MDYSDGSVARRRMRRHDAERRGRDGMRGTVSRKSGDGCRGRFEQPQGGRIGVGDQRLPRADVQVVEEA